MIKELNTTDTYRLVDKEGWLENSTHNPSILRSHPQLHKTFKINQVRPNGSGMYNGVCLIRGDEYQFFEVVKETSSSDESPEPKLWDGNLDNLEVGMVVKGRFGDESVVKYLKLEYGQVVVDGVQGLAIVHASDLLPTIKTEYEETLEEVLDVWNRKCLEYAHDSASSNVPLGEFFEVVYNVMKENNNE